jgi:hypothetical protein
MRRPIALAIASLTIGFGSLFFAAQGCGTSQPAVENLCGWLGDSSNCYRRFAQGVVKPTTDKDTALAPKCGVEIVNGEAVDAAGTKYPAEQKPNAGVFLTRDPLDVCFITATDPDGDQIGGRIEFDPPLDPNASPPTGFEFKIFDGLGAECGSGSFLDTNSFSITVTPPEGVGGSGGGGGSTTSSGTGGDDTSPLTYGTFSIAKDPAGEIIDTLCPNNEPHHFNLFQLNKCAEFTPILPMAVVESNPGSISKLDKNGNISEEGKLGYVRLSVFFPPTTGDLPGEKPLEIQYFDCQFPPPLPPCLDGVKGEGETDIDCGGLLCKDCVAKQTCITNSDCSVGVCACIPDMMGVRRCCGDGP